MELEEATLEDIAQELEKRPIRFCLVAQELTHGDGITMLSAQRDKEDALWLLGSAYQYVEAYGEPK